MLNSAVPVAIRAENLWKNYRLYESNKERAADLLGLYRLSFWTNKKFKEYSAIKGLSFKVERGERIGLIGRNGAGKSTLLKLITGLSKPTSGSLEVNGKVQALFHSGLGFHPDFTGLENLEASLLYNDLSSSEARRAIEDIIEFVELGEFINQPLKNYSSGMAARLAFAASTAVKPEILIVDEVLSAGDAYFSSKSVERVKRLIDGGTTLLLVSHSMEQVLQFCDKAIWIDNGNIVEVGRAMEVVKNYDRFSKELESKRLSERNNFVSSAERHLNSNSQGKISRWQGELGLKIRSLVMKDALDAECWCYSSGDQVKFEIEVEAEKSDLFKCKFAMNIFTLDGRMLALHCSEEDNFFLGSGDVKKIVLKYDRLLFGEGEFAVTFGIYKKFEFNRPDEAEIYDLLDRSFYFKVVRGRKNDPSILVHPVAWQLPSGKRVIENC